MSQTLCLCICTCERPQMLQKCLESTNNLILSDYWNLDILIINNGKDIFSATIENQLRLKTKFQVHFAFARNKGIPSARNMALQVCKKKKYEWIAFIDDDEVIDSSWLIEMASARRISEADVLHGMTESTLEISASAWPMKTKKRTRSALQTLQTAGTDNVLFSMRLILPAGMNLSFDENMRFTGGSDRDFFYRAFDKGAKIVWVPNAKTYEMLPASRQTFWYQVKRAQSVAANECYIHRKRKGLFKTILKLGPKAIGRLLGGILIIPFYGSGFIFKSNQLRLKLLGSSKQISSATGTFRGFLKSSPERYVEIHGR